MIDPLTLPHAEPPPANAFQISDLCRMLQTRLSEEQIQQIYQAYLMAAEAHDGQKRKSGEAYIYHPLAVARIVAEMNMDTASIMVALLHDVLEDTVVTREQMAAQFGDEIAEMVEGLSKLTNLEVGSKAEAQAENFSKMLLAMVNDIRVIIIKLSDRLHNMRTLGSMRLDKRRRIARETLEVYAPIAHRLGITQIQNELEDLGFAALYPGRYQVLEEAVRKARGNRTELVNQIEIRVKAMLEEMGIEAEVYGREKHIYSLYHKMRSKQLSFKEVTDMFAIRVVVADIDKCYRALGCLHGLYKPRPNSFKDYIAIPKSNGYQSLHTVMMRGGIPIEAQVRTEEMDHNAQHGVAAHWIYKSGKENTPQNLAQQWFSNLLDMQQATGSTLEFYESVKLDLFPKEIFVFSPKGDIYRLPPNATPVDFAYLVHSDIGNRCRGVRLDRRVAALSTPLTSGQTVDIITQENAQPSPMWLDFVATPRARNAIRQFLRNMDAERGLLFGRRLIARALGALGGNVDELQQEEIDSALAYYGQKDWDALLLNVGLGNLTPSEVAARLIGEDTDPEPARLQTSPLMVESPDGSVISMARCCLPIPGDNIQGVISSGRGVMVHRATCRNVAARAEKRSQDWVPVQWSENYQAEYTTILIVEMDNRPGSLARVADTISKLTSNIENMSFSVTQDSLTQIRFNLTVHNRVHLARLLRHLHRLPVVAKVRRESHE